MKRIADLKSLIERFRVMVRQRKSREAEKFLSELHPADIADISDDLEEEELKFLFTLLDNETASEVLNELEEPTLEETIDLLSIEKLAALIQELPDDDAADIIAQFPDEIRYKIINLLDKDEKVEIQHLLKYDEETAGGIMTREFVSISKDASVEEAISQIRAASEDVEDIFYVYVVDNDGVLVGVISLIYLIKSKPNIKIKDFMYSDVISVPTDMDQEEVAETARKYDLPVIPVVDEDGKLVGRITNDDILDVMTEEASEDISYMAGTDDEELQEKSSIRIASIRLPWLMVGMVGEIIAALVMSRFQGTLETVIALAFFVPVIIALGGNTGIQSTSIVVRGLATGEIDLFNMGKRILKELRIGLINGVACGLFIYFIASVWQGNPRLGVVIGLSMITVVLMASTVGAIVPLFLKKMNVDPAIATGPFVTTTNDIFGLLIYLGLANLMMDWIQ